MQNAASLSFTAFETEANFDFLTIDDTPGYSGNTGPTGVLVSPDSVITWTTDGSNVNTGFEVCATVP